MGNNAPCLCTIYSSGRIMKSKNTGVVIPALYELVSGNDPVILLKFFYTPLLLRRLMA